VGSYNGGIPSNPESAIVTIKLDSDIILRPIIPCRKPGNKYNVLATNNRFNITSYRKYSVSRVVPKSVVLR
jgi:hypothetical protein